MSHTIGIDLGGTRIKAAQVSEVGTLTKQTNIPLASRTDYGLIIEQLVQTVGELTAKESESHPAVGLAIAGLMNRSRERVLTAPNIPAINGKPIPADLEKQSGVPVQMDNDANLMALGEGAFGAAKGSRHYIAFTLGTGIGGAIIADGRMIRGVNNGGGELGHIPITAAGPRCGCGAHGCLEAFIGHDGIEGYVRTTHPHHAGKGMKELNRLAAEGDEEATDVFRYVGGTLAIALSGLVNVFNPEVIVIGGGISAAGDLVLKPLWDELHKRAFAQYLDSLRIKVAELGNWAGVVGAAAFANSGNEKFQS